MDTCSGFYFTGGSQSRIIDVFLHLVTQPSYATLMKRWREGAVVAGSSAGAAMMSQTMISGGSSREAIIDEYSGGTGRRGFSSGWDGILHTGSDRPTLFGARSYRPSLWLS